MSSEEKRGAPSLSEEDFQRIQASHGYDLANSMVIKEVSRFRIPSSSSRTRTTPSRNNAGNRRAVIFEIDRPMKRYRRITFISALGDATARCSVLEQELGKAQRTIAKSKRATEVQLLMQDNDSLKKKLHSQEEEFRAQNQTLLTELSNVSCTVYLRTPYPARGSLAI